MKHVGIVVGLVCVLEAGAWAQENAAKPDVVLSNTVVITSTMPPAGLVSESMNQEAKAALDRGLDWLAAQQKEDGSWSDTNFPALTALALNAFNLSEYPQKKAITAKAVKFLVSCAQPDGGIYRQVAGRKGGGLSNYNTAICVMALYGTQDASLNPVILAGRKYIAGSQYQGDDEYRGGFGYDRATQRAYTDLLNTYYSVETMKTTAGAEDARNTNEARVDINWDETVRYIAKMQGKPESGVENAGGFSYNPADPKAGTITNEAGVVYFRSFGTMTYAGTLALMHANVGRQDVRVRSAIRWAGAHWTLEENPGMGSEGLYFFYNILGKCLSAYGQDMLETPKGRVDWRKDLIAKLVATQKVDSKTGQGFWKNTNNRFWEDNEVLVTAYTLVALQQALQ